MAAIKLGSIVADITGSVGAETYARNQGGHYVKARAGPTAQPNANQIAVTDAMTLLSQAWSGDLTDQQRADWRRYAHQFPEPNRWGSPSLTNGYNRFIKVNFQIAQESQVVWTNSPPTAPPIGPPDFPFVACVATNLITIGLPVMPTTPPDVTYFGFCYTGITVPPGVAYYTSPFTFIEYFNRTYTTWIASPPQLWSTAALVAGQKLFMRMRLINSVTKAQSSPAIASAIIEP